MNDGSNSRASVTVEIAGEEYTLRTNADEAYTRRCAALVNERMAQVRAGGLDRQKAAILVALSLSDDVLQRQQESERLQEAVKTRVDTLADTLTNAIGADPDS